MMKKRNLKSILSITLALILCLGCLIGCGTVEPTAPVNEGGILNLKVNPEIAILYDADGNMTELVARNRDGEAILAGFPTDSYVGKPCSEVVNALVTAIGEAGYFVEEIEGKTRRINLEVEDGSRLPDAAFLDNLTDMVLACVETHDWTSPVRVKYDDDEEIFELDDMFDRYDDLDDRYGDWDDCYDDDCDDRNCGQAWCDDCNDDDRYDDWDDRCDDWDDRYDDWDDRYDDWDDRYDDWDDRYDDWDDRYDDWDDRYDDDWDDRYDDDWDD